MFTGIIEELGSVQGLFPAGNGQRLTLAAPYISREIQVKDSIAVNGCCLTCIQKDKDLLTLDIVEETLRKTCLEDLKVGIVVNLERPMILGGRLDGHLVQGHVDGVGSIVSKKQKDDHSYEVTFQAPPEIIAYIVEKGSIAVDGVSLTAWNVQKNFFSVALIPYTAKNTTLGIKSIGDRVNLEVDLIAKYVEKLSGIGRKNEL
ncbi:MAG: riboflavin synthase [Parachlamydiaceae bacterium]